MSPLSRRCRTGLAVLAVVVTLAGTESSWAAQAQSQAGHGVQATQAGGQGNDQGVPADDASRGLHYGDLRRSDTSAACKGAFELRLAAGKTGCTHGPDPAPEGVDVRQPRRSGHAGQESPIPVEAPAEPSVALAPPCQGDGTSGQRVQLVYAHASGVTDRYNTMLASFRTWATQMDDVFNLSAGETGGTRHIRFVHDASCNPIVLNVTLTASGDDSLTNTINELRNQGHNRSDRKYMVWVDANVYCGIAQVYGDDRNIAGNYNNGPSGIAGMVARVDNGCWGVTNGLVEVHELVHTLGGVQTSAPNSTANSHCVDDYDRMCYSDAPGVSMRIACSSTAHENRLDCNHDDYYSTAPVAGGYLATHWNVANSSFLAGSGTPPPTTTTTLPPTTTTTTLPPTTTTTKPPTTTTSTTKPPTTTSTTTTVPPGSTPMGRFVDKAYRDLLGRAPSATEMNILVSGNYPRSAITTGITTSPEYRRLIVNSYYQSLLGRSATSGELDALVNAIAGGWPFEYAQTIVLGSSEFYTRQGSTVGGYVDALFAYVLGVAPDPPGRAFWIDQIIGKGLDRYSVALAFATYSGTHQRVVDFAFPWLLRRAPSASERTGWTSQLDSGAYRVEAFFAALVASDEYWSKV